MESTLRAPCTTLSPQIPAFGQPSLRYLPQKVVWDVLSSIVRHPFLPVLSLLCTTVGPKKTNNADGEARCYYDKTDQTSSSGVRFFFKTDQTSSSGVCSVGTKISQVLPLNGAQEEATHTHMPKPIVRDEKEAKVVGFIRQLQILSKKNYVLKKRATCCVSQCCRGINLDCGAAKWEPTCCCFCCPFVPLIAECILPLFLLLALSQLKTLFILVEYPSGWVATDGVGVGSEPPTMINEYWYDAFSGSSFGSSNDMMVRATPLVSFIQDVQSTFGPCSKIALAPSTPDGLAEVQNFRDWVDSTLVNSTQIAGFNANCRTSGAFSGNGDIQTFLSVTTLFESLDQFNTYVTTQEYQNTQPKCEDPRMNTPCSAACSNSCMEFSSTCHPQISAAIILDTTGIASNQW